MEGRKFALIFLLILSANLLFSCNTNNSGDAPPTNTEIEFMGVYAQGIEDSWFYSCEYEEPAWKPEFNEQSFGQLHEFWENRDPDGGPFMKVRIVGVLSSKGNYQGIFETYDREIQILSILDIDYTEDTDC